MLRKAISNDKPVFNIPVYMFNSDSKRIPITVNAAILRNHRGRMIGGVETFRDLSNLSKLRKYFHKHHSFENMVSKNQKMLEIFSTLKLIADSDCTVLIEGATGTGKEMLAKAVHNNSPHRNGPFVPVNCGRAARYPDRIRTVWIQGRRLYGCQNGQAGTLSESPERHDIPWMK